MLAVKRITSASLTAAMVEHSKKSTKFVHNGCTAKIYQYESSYISLLVIHTCCAAVFLGRKCLGLVYEEIHVKKYVTHAKTKLTVKNVSNKRMKI